MRIQLSKSAAHGPKPATALAGGADDCQISLFAPDYVFDFSLIEFSAGYTKLARSEV